MTMMTRSLMCHKNTTIIIFKHMCWLLHIYSKVDLATIQYLNKDINYSSQDDLCLHTSLFADCHSAENDKMSATCMKFLACTISCVTF